MSGTHNLQTFYCAGCRMHLGEAGMKRELADLARRTGHPRSFGTLSLGEIGVSVCGGSPLLYKLFHHRYIHYQWREQVEYLAARRNLDTPLPVLEQENLRHFYKEIVIAQWVRESLGENADTCFKRVFA